MEQKDIVNLFSYIKSKLPPTAKIPTLDKPKAAAWCQYFEGYTLAQLKQAAESWTALKPFWPDADELKPLLPPLVERLDMDHDLMDWWRRRKAQLKAAGVPTLYEALHQGMTMDEYDRLCEEKGV